MDYNPQQQGIRWPEDFRPEKASVFVSNQLVINAPPEQVWAWLVRAVWWPSWYPNSADVLYANQTDLDLRQDTKFRWKTFGLKMQSEVAEYVPSQRLAWSARGIGIKAYHAWLIQPVQGGCQVLTEETQRGTLAKIGKVFFPGRMHRFHQIWLEALRQRAEGGPP